MCLMLYVGCKEPSDAPHVAPAAGACRDGYLATGANELSDVGKVHYAGELVALNQDGDTADTKGFEILYPIRRLSQVH